jgi:ferredoxin-NADP reductase
LKTRTLQTFFSFLMMQALEAKALAAGFCKARVVSASFLTPAVRKLRFEISESGNPFQFKHAGQWVDCVIPQAGNVVGGFSLTSSPLELPQLELAVKISEHPPAKAAVTATQIDDEWLVRVGGKFGDVLEQPKHQQDERLLLAAGIGITPLIGMLKHALILSQQGEIEFPRTTLLFSAKSLQDLAYHSDLLEIERAVPEGRFTYVPFTTIQGSASEIKSQNRRISKEDLKMALAEKKKELICLLCGPKNFATDMDRTLQELGLSRDRILYEAWW